MIILLSLSAIVLSLLINIGKKGTFFTASTVFTVTWCLCLAVSSLGLFGLYIPSNYVYKASFISVFIFNFIPLLQRKRTLDFNLKDINGGVRYGFLYVFHVFAYIFSIPLLMNSVRYIMQHGFGAIRGAELGQSTYTVLAMQWICLPLFMITIICAGIGLATKNISKPVVILALFDTALYALMYGGRYIIVKLLFCIAVAFVIAERGRILSTISKHKKIVIFILIGVWLLSYLTSMRSLSNMNFMGNIVGYFTGSFVFLSELLKKGVHEGVLGYGSMTFGCILNFIYAIGKVLFGIDYQGTNTLVETLTGDYLRIGANTLYNAMPTTLFYFILDYGKSFFWIGMVVLALFSHAVESAFYKNRDWKSLCRYIYVLYTLFNSVLLYNYRSPGDFMIFVMIELLISSQSKDNSDGQVKKK